MQSDKMKAMILSAAAALLPAYGASASANPIEIKIMGVSLQERLGRALEFLLSIAGSIALLMLIGSGIYYVITAGNPDSQAKAKKMMIAVLTGLILILMSYAIIKVVSDLATV